MFFHGVHNAWYSFLDPGAWMHAESALWSFIVSIPCSEMRRLHLVNALVLLMRKETRRKTYEIKEQRATKT